MSTDRCVLVAEAELPSQRRIREALLRAGISADGSADTVDVIRRLQSRRYLVLLLDIANPSIDPQQVLASLASVAQKERPIIVALGTAETARSLESELVHVVMRKPVLLGQLVPIVESCVRELARREQMPTPVVRPTLTS